MPDGAIYVGRPSKHGNLFEVGAPLGSLVYHLAPEPIVVPMTHALAVDLHFSWLYSPEQAALRRAIRRELRGADLVCWCKPEQPCHADTLLLLANWTEE